MKSEEEWDIDQGVLEHMVSLYVNELYWLLHSVKTKSESLFDRCKVPEKGWQIMVDMEAFSLIKSIVDDSAQVANLISPSPQRKNEPEAKGVYRIERAKYLRGLIGEKLPAEILRQDVRDSLEHFDERLDRLTHRVSKNIKKKGRAIAHNMVISEKSAFNPFPYPLRVYISAERVFYSLDWRVNIGRIYQECCSMIENLKSTETIKKTEEPGGLLLMIPRNQN